MYYNVIHNGDNGYFHVKSGKLVVQKMMHTFVKHTLIQLYLVCIYTMIILIVESYLTFNCTEFLFRAERIYYVADLAIH